MLEHLISHELDPLLCELGATDFVGLSPTTVGSRVATPTEILNGQSNTADWLEEMGLTAAKAEPKASAATVHSAFTALVTQDTQAQREALCALHLPDEIRHLVGMLTAYDWQFVAYAKELRGYVVAKLVDETRNPKADIRLRALGMLGKVTEVGLFTEKIEVKKIDMTNEEIEARIKDKLGKFMGVVDAVDISSHDPELPTDKPQ